jgi:DNA-nicking Smr family endonuclease
VFALTREGERVYALAPGVDARHLRRLRRGELEVDRELDLHGQSERSAREDVAFELRDAFEEGERCVRIVHGRGRHSPAGPVLKEALLGWLQRRPLSDLILAFSSAPPAQGGSGALLVLLRRRRAKGHET